MNKELLKHAAMQLLEAEEICRKLYKYNEDFDEAYKKVISLENHVKEIQKQIPEIAERKFWWNTPFSPEEYEDTDNFCFEGGKYIESDAVKTREDDEKIILYKKSSVMDYSQLARDLTEGLYAPIFVNKKQLRLHMNAPMKRRELYHVISFQSWEAKAPDLTQDKESVAEIWQDYQEEAVARQEKYEDYLRAYNEKMDFIEKMAHLSLFTNEERWFAGRMSTEDYLKESTLREWGALEKNSKMQHDLQYLRMQATRETQKLRERQMEMRRNALFERTIIRLFPVGHVVYCEDEIIAIFINQKTTAVFEYECDSNVEIPELTGQCYNERLLYNKKPMLIPLVRYIANAYKNRLPDFNVLSLRPNGCPEQLWRNWVAARWITK